MDFQRIFLFLIFTFSTFLLWESWQRAQQPPIPLIAQSTTNVAPEASVLEPTTISKNSIVPAISNQKSTILENKAQPGQKITVKTDYLVAVIDTAGGDLRHLEFLKQYDILDRNKPFVLLQEEGAHTYISQTGLLGEGLPTHNTEFFAQAGEYQLAEGQDTLEVRLSAVGLSGVKVNKVYTFHRASYVIDVGFDIENIGSSDLMSSAYYQLVRDKEPPAGGSKLVPTYTGPAVYTDVDKFQKVSFADIEKGKAKHTQNADNGWVGMLQHYFVAAWLPKDKTPREFYTKHLDADLYSAGVILPLSKIAPGQSASISVPLYAGPAQMKLNEIAPGLGLTVDYGWLTVIATPMFWLLTFLHGWVSNWGVAIILLTVLIKLAFFPLSAASYRSMGKMRVVAPKLERLKQQYGDDRERLQKAMMELYKAEKINPLGGCLPVVIQIPVFIALYWSILASVEMRYAPFFGWITDLSAADPYYVLPVIMGISMVIQSRLNPTPPDPLQAKLMKIMPIAFSAIFFVFPAGLVLYSIVNNVLSIAQQRYITRSLQTEAKGVAKPR